MSDAIPFCDPPDSQDRGPRYLIVRCDKSERYHVPFFCLSNHVFGFVVHYVGRSVICGVGEEPCEWCAAGRAKRWVGYVAGMDESKQKRFLVELTAGVMPDVARFTQTWKTLRGHFLTLTRPSHRPTAKLRIDFAGHGKYIPEGDCPKSFNVPSSLALIYGLTHNEAKGENVPESIDQALEKTLRDSMLTQEIPNAGTDAKSIEELESRLRSRGNGHPVS